MHIEEVYKNKQLTFEDIDKLSYKHFNKFNKKENDYFNPHDYIDIDNTLDQKDEILKKYAFQDLTRSIDSVNQNNPME